ncbi:hypothetical protein GCM10010300_32360 [Streptomyces olivaceoviridis]|uniref:hypothetical protein n=1 Tax=Streptomyces olivaceoviridis TaxID=1921 RepID=UPI0016720035|nr:hypothetical protein [Streptomyces olivaceoviridis]GGY85805.1 hypothetical protein GCM10010300_32360 [Streptomyces olivaceoviridis]
MTDDPMRAMIRDEILRAMRETQPAQYTRADLAHMSPEQIAQARRAGHLDDLLSGRN